MRENRYIPKKSVFIGPGSSLRIFARDKQLQVLLMQFRRLLHQRLHSFLARIFITKTYRLLSLNIHHQTYSHALENTTACMSRNIRSRQKKKICYAILLILDR